MKKDRSLISFLVGIILFGVAIYITYYVTTIVDFNDVTIIIKDNENLWKFMAFIPMLTLMFVGGLAVINSLFNSRAIAICIILLNIALTLFIQHDLYGFVSILPKYQQTMEYLYLIALIASLMILIDQVIARLKNEPKTKRKVKEA